MKTHRFWGSLYQKTTVLLLAAAVLSIIALIWMGLRLMQQDRILEMQQLEEKRAAATENLAAALDRLLVNEEKKLAEPPEGALSPDEGDYILVYANSEGIQTWPENTLLFYPVMPSGIEAPSRPFISAERFEFQAHL